MKTIRTTIVLLLAFVLVSMLSIAISTRSQSETVKTYKAVEEITILDASRTINGVEHGMFTFSDNCAFGFSPKERFLNVTKIIGNLYGYCEGSGFHHYSVQINGMSCTQGSRIDQIESYVMHSMFGCDEPSILSGVKPGINMLTIDFMGGHVNIMKIVLLIEYEYQA